MTCVSSAIISTIFFLLLHCTSMYLMDFELNGAAGGEGGKKILESSSRAQQPSLILTWVIVIS